MAVRKPSCGLEALKFDVQLNLLSSCESTTDLYSLLRASPILYQSFLRHKSFVLVRLNFNLLGPAGIHAAILISKTLHHDFFKPEAALQKSPKSRDAELRNILENLSLYPQMWSPGQANEEGCPLSGLLEWDIILRVNRLAKVAVHICDLYTRTRLCFFRGELGPRSGCDWEVTTSEKHRIRTATLRLEIVDALCRRMHDLYWPFKAPRHTTMTLEDFLLRVAAMYQSWEWEQILEMHRFKDALREREDRIWEMTHVQSAGLEKIPGIHSALDDTCRPLYSGDLAWLSMKMKIFERHLSPDVFNERAIGKSRPDVSQQVDFHRQIAMLDDVDILDISTFLENWIHHIQDQVGEPQVFAPIAAGKASTPQPVEFRGDSLKFPRDPAWAWTYATDLGSDLVWADPNLQFDDDTWLLGSSYRQSLPRKLAGRWRLFSLVFWDKRRAKAIIDKTGLSADNSQSSGRKLENRFGQESYDLLGAYVHRRPRICDVGK